MVKWLEFRNKFLETIHNKEELDESNKLEYLVQSLEGRPAQLVGDSSKPKNNYSDVWNSLRQFYDKPYRIALESMRQFFALPVLSTKATALDLQTMANITRETMNRLHALELPVEHYNFIIVASLHDRLDKETRTEWNKYRNQDQMPTLADMLNFLEWEAPIMKGDLDLRPASVASEESLQRNSSQDRSGASSSASNSTTSSGVASRKKYTGTVPKLKNSLRSMPTRIRTISSIVSLSNL